MKKIFLTSTIALGAIGLFSCERTSNNEGKLDENKNVVARDTIVTEYEVEETIVEYDTTTRTKKVDASENKKRENR